MSFLDQIKRLDGVVRAPATEEQVKLLEAEILDEFDVELPMDYVEFLKSSNGIMWNGLVLYATDEVEDAPDGARIPAFRERNEHFDDYLEIDEYMILGDFDDELIVYNLETLEYMQLDMVSLDINERFASLEGLMSQIINYLTPSGLKAANA